MIAVIKNRSKLKGYLAQHFYPRIGKSLVHNGMKKQYADFIFTALILCLLFGNSFGQVGNVDGRFIEKQTKVGTPVHYILKLKHDPDLEVVFPDSTYDFTPFELLDKEPFPTKTDSTGSMDSVVYTVSTFETDARQGLRLPVFIADPRAEDGRRPLYPRADSIDIVPLVQSLPDSVSMIENTQVADVKEEFNYPYLLIGAGVAIVLGIVVYFVFGNKVRQFFLLKNLKKEHEAFVSSFQRYSEGSSPNVEKAISIWKRHAGLLLEEPMASYTTKEISRKISNIPDSVLTALRKADQAIYAGLDEEDLLGNLRELRAFAEQAYQDRVAAIKRGEAGV